MPSVVAYDTEERDGVRVPARIRRFATVRKQQNSAETMLYLLIVVMTAVPAFLAGYAAFACMPGAPAWLPAACRAVLNFAALCLLMRSYARALADLYTYFYDRSDASINPAYANAWIQHGFDIGEHLDA